MKDIDTQSPLEHMLEGTQTLSLGTGTLTLTTFAAERDGLYRLAERQNPKRAFLFVSTVLGRHIPVAPHAHRDALQALADKAAPLLGDGAVFVMGYAETAVGIGAGVFDCLRGMLPGRQMGYLHTTRHNFPDTDPWFTIEEGHSHATHHYIQKPAHGVCAPGEDATLVLVDDETTSGSTFAQLAGALFEQGARFGRIVLVTLTDWSDGAAISRVAEATGCADVHAVSLLQGAWSWAANPGAALPALPTAGDAGCPAWSPDRRMDWQSPRLGLCENKMHSDMHALKNLALPQYRKGERVLVIGSGEHVWQPFLVAETLERDGLEVGFIATTRSPILPGPVIRHKITFPDHFGIGLDMYLHNVNPDDWDHIVLLTETGIDGVHPDLRAALGKGHIIDGAGMVHPMSDN